MPLGKIKNSKELHKNECEQWNSTRGLPLRAFKDISRNTAIEWHFSSGIELVENFQKFLFLKEWT